MSADGTRRAVEAYIADLNPMRLSENAELWDMRSATHVRGRTEVGAWLRRLSSRALATPRLVRSHLTVGEDAAAAEWELRGRRVELAEGENPATYEVSIPMVGVFEVEAGVITRVRVYYDAHALQAEKPTCEKGELACAAIEEF